MYIFYSTYIILYIFYILHIILYIVYIMYLIFALIFSCGILKTLKSYVKNAMGSSLTNRLLPFLYYGQKQFTTMNPHISLEKVL